MPACRCTARHICNNAAAAALRTWHAKGCWLLAHCHHHHVILNLKLRAAAILKRHSSCAVGNLRRQQAPHSRSARSSKQIQIKVAATNLSWLKEQPQHRKQPAAVPASEHQWLTSTAQDSQSTAQQGAACTPHLLIRVNLFTGCLQIGGKRVAGADGLKQAPVG
jgi:hypothetical protein